MSFRYSFTELEIDRLPASLHTDHGSMTSVFVTGEAEDNPGAA